MTSVALVTPGWPPSRMPNGIVTYTASMRDAFTALGVPAHVLVCDFNSWNDPDVISIFEIGVRARAGRSARWRVRQLLGRRQLGAIEEAVIARTAQLRRSAGLTILEMEESHGWAATVARRGVVPVVTRLHGPWFLNGRALGVVEDELFRARVAGERDAILSASVVSAPSVDVLERTREYYNVSLRNADVIPSPVPPASRECVWSNANCLSGTIVFAGRFDRHKGADLVIDAFAILAGRDPGLRLLFAGPHRGFLDDDGRRWTAPEYVARLPSVITERITFLGQLSHAQLRELRLSGAVVVIASRYENQPYSALEALSQGCPVVAARAGGLPELIEHERNGLLFTAGKAEDLAEQVARLVDDPALAGELGAQARRDSIARHAPEQIAQRTLDLYRRVT